LGAGAPGRPLTSRGKPVPRPPASPSTPFSRPAPQVERIAAAEAAAKDGRAPPTDAPPRLSDECRAVAEVGAPPNMKRAFDESLSVALLGSQLTALESRSGVELVSRDARTGRARGVTLTGWTALLGVAALVVAVLAGLSYAWRQYSGTGDASTVVLKSQRGAGYSRVSTSGS
jgi:hypothetical protein